MVVCNDWNDVVVVVLVSGLTVISTGGVVLGLTVLGTGACLLQHHNMMASALLHVRPAPKGNAHKQPTTEQRDHSENVSI